MDIADVVKQINDDPTFAKFCEVMKRLEKGEIGNAEAAKLAADLMAEKIQDDLDNGHLHQMLTETMLTKIEAATKGKESGSNNKQEGSNGETNRGEGGGKLSVSISILLWIGVIVQGWLVSGLLANTERFPGIAIAWLIILLPAAIFTTMLAAWGLPGRRD